MTSALFNSSLARVAAASRAALLQRDAALLGQLRAYYVVARKDLVRSLSTLVSQIEDATADGQEISKAWLQRQTRYKALIEQIDTTMASYGEYAAPRIEAAQAAAARLGSVHARQMLDAVGIEASFNRLPVKAIESLVGVLGDGSPLSDIFDTFGSQASQAAKDALVSGLVRGKNPRETARAVQKALDTTATRALTIARTETLRAYRAAALETYQASADVLNGWTWLAASGACPFCTEKDGTHHALDEGFDTHPNCRCACTPWLKEGTA